MDKVVIFDTTLRDGEQSPGATLSIEEKLDIARQLARMGVDIIETGFPCTSPGDFESVQRIGKEISNATICALARTHPKDIDITWDALKVAARPRIHMVVSTSDIHLKHQLKMSRAEVLEMSIASVKHARRYNDDIEFSLMDATRSDPLFIYQILENTIAAGATTVNIADTVGYTTPEEFGALIRGICENVPNIHRAVISVHCHNDLGMGTANSLIGVVNGARQVECTINGIGERAGNASLEEVVMALHTRRDQYHVDTNVDISQIYKTSRMVSNYTGMFVQPNKAIVGANAFAHESGIHQDGVLKEPSTYEIIDGKTVGQSGTNIVLGKHSGRHAFKSRLAALGYELTHEDLSRAFLRFKQLADKKKVVSDPDLEALIADEIRAPAEVYHLDQVQVSCGDRGIPTATVQINSPEGEILADAALGTGPIDAVYKAINRIIGVPNQLIEFSVRSVTAGIDAVGEVTIRIESNGKIYAGRGGSTDIIVASAKAYMNALNGLIASQRASEAHAKKHVQ